MNFFSRDFKLSTVVVSSILQMPKVPPRTYLKDLLHLDLMTRDRHLPKTQQEPLGCLVLFPLNMTHFHQPRSCKVELPAKYPSKSLEVQSWALTTEVLEIPRLGSPIIVRHVFQWCWTSILNELVHLISSRIHLLPLHPNTSDTTPGGLMDMFQPPLCLGPSSIHLRVCNFILRSAELVSKLVILFP